MTGTSLTYNSDYYDAFSDQKKCGHEAVRDPEIASEEIDELRGQTLCLMFTGGACEFY